MSKLTRAALALLAGGMTLLALSTPGSATIVRGRENHVVVEGTWTDAGPTIDSVSPDGPNYMVAFHGSTTVFGSFAGASSYSFTIRFDPRNGKSRGSGNETFAASLDGKGAGTVTFAEQFHQAADGSTDVTGTVVGGAGVFDDAHGTLRFVGATQPGTTTATGTYRLLLELSS